MQTTTKNHWVNGYQVRGGGVHKSYAFTILGRYGVLVSHFRGETLPRVTAFKFIIADTDRIARDVRLLQAIKESDNATN